MDVATRTEPVPADLTPDEIVLAPDECLDCYLNRMLSRYGCDNGRRFTVHWRDSQRRSMPNLLAWLSRNGGYCDCEVIMNVFDRGLGPTIPGLRCQVALKRAGIEEDIPGEEWA